jgi:hypothetical protein
MTVTITNLPKPHFGKKKRQLGLVQTKGHFTTNLSTMVDVHGTQSAFLMMLWETRQSTVGCYPFGALGGLG